MNWFATFLFLYALGTCATLAVLPGRPLGGYFFRFHAFVVVGMLILAGLVGQPLLAPRPPGTVALTIHIAAAAFALSGLALAAAIGMTRGDVPSRIFLLPVPAGAALAILTAFSAHPGWFEGGLRTAHLLSGALLLGTSVVAMILGHWYLVNAALSFDLLLRLTRLLLLAIAVKLLVSGTLVALNFERLATSAPEFDRLLAGLRAAVGLLGAGVLAFMAHSCAKIKSNQSATGILYITVVLVLIGELVSVYLTLERGLPV
ncbi:MAG: hypothetical protein HYY16_07070 [Planctomycetes bacterium]|nr:hypothetical protein [Planctomycetota bacterium]